MTSRADLTRQVHAAIDRRAEEIVAIGERIRKTPELGFKEERTARLVAETFGRLGLPPRTGLAFTGVRAEARGRAGDGPTFALIGELDALVVAGHPERDPTTGAAHACGHNAQVAAMLGAAMGLLDADAFAHLAGRVVFFAVPAEEGGDLEWRIAQKRAGQLEFLSGKQELIRLGAFDDIDLAMMIHMSWRAGAGHASLQASNNGRLGKAAVFTGRAAHAGGAPHLGVNALYAAQLALTAINAVRETFRDDDAIRVHPILTHGGSQVNVIPGHARLEMYVRGKTADGILEASRKVDRALRAGALALGATVEIETVPGPLPLLNDPTMERLFHGEASALVGAEHVKRTGHSGGCTDMGDVSHLMPVLHPYMGGASGTGHGADYAIVDPQLAYVTPAKALASMAIDLLAEGAERAGEILRQSRPRMTRPEYLAFQRGLEQRQLYDESGASGAVVARPRFSR